MTEFDYLILNIKEAIGELYQEDRYLIHHGIGKCNTSHVSEVGIVFRLGIYLNRRIVDWLKSNEYSLDIEYNRDGDNVKWIPNDTGTTENIRPDLIIHKRGTNDANILVIEFKTWWNEHLNEAVNKDRNKLKKLTKTTGHFHYKYGLFIMLTQDRDSVEYYHYQNGERVSGDLNE